MSVADPVLHDPALVLYSDHHSRLCEWIRKRLDNVCDAANVAQDTFISVMEGRQANVIREPRLFLAIVAKRLLAHRHRRRVLKQAYLGARQALPEESASLHETGLLAPEARQTTGPWPGWLASARAQDLPVGRSGGTVVSTDRRAPARLGQLGKAITGQGRQTMPFHPGWLSHSACP